MGITESNSIFVCFIMKTINRIHHPCENGLNPELKIYNFDLNERKSKGVVSMLHTY